GDGEAARETGERLRALGAAVQELPAAALVEEDGAAAWARERAPVHAFVFDAGGGFGSGGDDALTATMAAAWRAIRAIAARRPPPCPRRPGGAGEPGADAVGGMGALRDHRGGAVAGPRHHQRRAGRPRLLSHLARRRLLQRLPVRARRRARDRRLGPRGDRGRALLRTSYAAHMRLLWRCPILPAMTKQ